MTTQDEDNRYWIDPDKLPKQIEIELKPETLQQLKDLAEASGRSIDEFILEILDKSLKDRQSP